MEFVAQARGEGGGGWHCERPPWPSNPAVPVQLGLERHLRGRGPSIPGRSADRAHRPTSLGRLVFFFFFLLLVFFFLTLLFTSLLFLLLLLVCLQYACILINIDDNIALAPYEGRIVKFLYCLPSSSCFPIPPSPSLPLPPAPLPLLPRPSLPLPPAPLPLQSPTPLLLPLLPRPSLLLPPSLSGHMLPKFSAVELAVHEGRVASVLTVAPECVTGGRAGTVTLLPRHSERHEKRP